MGLDNFLYDRITEEDTLKFTLPEILHARARHTPDQTAYIFLRDGEEDEEKITYRELDQAARTIAHRLLQWNMKGERALMLFPPGLAFIKSLYACFYAGVIAVPAYPPRKNRSIDRIKTLVIDSGASMVLSITEIRQSSERSFMDMEELNSLKWMVVDGPNDPFGLPEEADVFPSPGDTALLQYTSGSTGQPKGVMVTHRNIIRNVEFIRQSFELTRKSVSVTWLPSFHDMGLIDGVIEPVYLGFPGIIIPPVNFLQKPYRWLKAISKYKGTHSGAPNFAFDLCVDGISGDERQGIDLSSLSTLYCGAEPIRKTTFERFAAAYKDFGFSPGALYPCYGMAETTLITSGPKAGRGAIYLGLSGPALEQDKILPIPGQDPDARFLVGVGYPWIDTTVRIVHPDTGKPCREDEVGEIWVSGSIVTVGYWNKPEETEKTFRAYIQDDPSVRFLRTGDLGFVHQGELYISGRLKDLIIIYGRNYYPQDIEFLAERSHPALRSNASAAFSVDAGDEEKLVIVAEVERTALRDLDVEAVCDAIRQQVAEEFELEVYAILLLRTASILKTSSGKIQRKACREGYLHQSLDIVGESILDKFPPPGATVASPEELVNIQAWLISWMHIRLKIPVERIDLSKPMAAHGMSSMKAVHLQQDFLEKYGVDFPPYLFFEKISLGELCKRALGLMKENN